MAEDKWRDGPPALPESGIVPCPWLILCLEIRATFWNVLAYEHDGLTRQAEAARRECARSAWQLRQAFDPHPALGLEAADAMIAWQVRYAREDFARDLAEEGRPYEIPKSLWYDNRPPLHEWRSRRGRWRVNR